MLAELGLDPAQPIVVVRTPPAVSLYHRFDNDLFGAVLERLRGTLPGAIAGTHWQLLDSPTPVQALLIGDSDAASSVSARLERHGVRVPAIRPPTVAPGSARLRIALSAAHTADDVDRLVACLHAVASAG